MDLYFAERERYLDNMARSKAMCADKLRHHDCCAWECNSCEKQKLWDSCVEGLDDYSKLLLNDKIDVLMQRLPVESPTYEEVAEKIESDREIRRKAVVQARKDLNWEWLHSGALVPVIIFFLVPVIVPIIGCMEWFL